jgi:hypothetical protein
MWLMRRVQERKVHMRIRTRPKLAILSAAVLAIPLLALAASGGTAQAQISEWGYTYNLASFQHTSMCLNAPSTTLGAALNQEPCQGQSGEEWTRVQVTPGVGGYLSTATYFVLYNFHTGYCASVKNNSNSPGAEVIQANCIWDGTDLYELWFSWNFGSGIDLGCTNEYSTIWCEYTNLGVFNGSKNVYSLHPANGSTGAGQNIYMNDNGSVNNYLYDYPPLLSS